MCVGVCVRVWGGCIIGRRVSAPSGKVFPCIRAAQAWSRLGGGELCVRRGIRWLIVREAPWKLPETRYQLLPGPPPQTHLSGGGVGAGLAQQSPLPAPPPTGTPSGLPLPTRQLKCPMGPQGTKRSLVPKITPDAKVIFQPGPGGLGLPIPQSKASNRQGPGGGCSETRPPRGTDPSLAGLQARLLSSQNSPKSHLHIRKRLCRVSNPGRPDCQAPVLPTPSFRLFNTDAEREEGSGHHRETLRRVLGQQNPSVSFPRST